MLTEITDVDRRQSAYKAAVDEWIDAIRKEESLASRNLSVEQVDRWEQYHFVEEEARKRAETAKRNYEAALREKFYGF